MNALLLKSGTSKDVCFHHSCTTGTGESSQCSKIEKGKSHKGWKKRGKMYLFAQNRFLRNQPVKFQML